MREGELEADVEGGVGVRDAPLRLPEGLAIEVRVKALESVGAEDPLPAPRLFEVGVPLLLRDISAVRVSVAVVVSVGALELDALRLGLVVVVGEGVKLSEAVEEAEVLPDTLPLPPCTTASPCAAAPNGVKEGSSGVDDTTGEEVAAVKPPPPEVTVGNPQGVKVKHKVGMDGREGQGESHPGADTVGVDSNVGSLVPLPPPPMELKEECWEGVGAPLLVPLLLPSPDMLGGEDVLGVIEGCGDGLPPTPNPDDGETLGEEDTLVVGEGEA